MIGEIIYHVQFPKLNINININPNLLTIGNFSIKWYGLILSIAFLCSFFYILQNRKKFNISKENIYNLTFASTIPAIIGARLYYVLFFPGAFYKVHPEKILAVSEGGIAIYGAIIGGILGIAIIAKIRHLPFLSVLDLLSIGVVIGQAIGRWGNFVNQEAFGEITDLPWGMMSENTAFETVHPCFLYESLGCVLIFLILHILTPKLKKSCGNIFLIYTMLYGALRFAVESLRTDSLIIPMTNIRVSQLLALLLCILSTGAILVRNLKLTKKHQKIKL